MPIGTIYGVLLNDAAALGRRRDAFRAPPYRAPPVAPVLYIKPRNTIAADGATVLIPTDPGSLRIDATIGAVIGRPATRVAAADALSYVAGYAIVGDVALPHASVHRPAIRERCRDGFCPLGATTPAAAFDPSTATVVIAIDGAEVHRRTLDGLVRPLPQLIADVTAFMTLSAGDLLLLGAADDAPLAYPGSVVTITVDGLGSLTHRVALEPTP